MHRTPTPPPRGRWLASAALTAATLAACASTPPQAPPAPPPSDVSHPAAEPATGDAALQLRFNRWITDFSASARAAGIDEATLHAAFGEVRYLPRVVELDRAQPEFTRTVWDYLDIAVSPQRIALGRQKLQQVRAEAAAAEARFGVPAPVVTAIWGIESNYGGNVGSLPIVDALATLGFEGRREDWARGQLLAALKILQSGDIPRAQLIGSWAGAMGQTQFLPSAFLTYAVDADGDGRRDLWGSVADVMASTANFLARSGWQAGVPWGVEVRLPAGFDPARADDALRQASERWADEGVRTMDGTPLPAFADGAILQPAGARGPAFLVGPNFRAILRYNNATSYALAVGLLAQRLADGPGVQAPWPRELTALTRSQMMALQTALNRRGFDSGPVDGLMGPATRSGIRWYQRSIGVPADGYPTPDLLQRLQEP
ncbi:lytic murein transglycosylase [Aquincola sp. S2]|uniref:Lytic murein transglycosylase n=1 Tax=Pseudaquabacterium terrae TaxID=2732868 RepID=A0ABX2EFD4_9BURK|nr:lytic murein transglycosylase [Aquabacterium terrae]NRF67334.1 lytic murein transglycosylase [Aquabacterium terrae]